MPDKRILLGWELGGGFGYVVKIRALADGLADHGYTPIIALRSLDRVHALLADSPHKVVQAPYLVGRLSPHAQLNGFWPSGFADLMACNGFGSVDHLYSMVRGWRDLVDLIKPDLIVGTYCPLLTMAVWGRIPAVVFGSPYYLPPADGDRFPPFQTDMPPYFDQARMLENIQRVQRLFRGHVASRVTDIYRGDSRWITAIPEIDPYIQYRNETCAGIFDLCSPPRPSIGHDFFAYLSGDGYIPRMVASALLSSGRTGSIYVRDATVESWGLPASDLVHFHRTAPDLQKMVRKATIVIHHGGPGTAQAALAAGRRQIMLPNVFDQRLTAEALSPHPFVISLVDEASTEIIHHSLDDLYQNSSAETAAVEFANSILQRGLHNAKAGIITACLQQLT